MANHSDQIKKLRDKGFKITPGRKDILEIFSIEKKPINAEEVFNRIKKGNGRTRQVNLVTVYRTLASLEQAKIIQRVDLRKGSVCYELVGDHHHHVTCVRCGYSENFENCNIDKISKEVTKQMPSFADINEHSFELFGVCKPCSGK